MLVQHLLQARRLRFVRAHHYPTLRLTEQIGIRAKVSVRFHGKAVSARDGRLTQGLKQPPVTDIVRTFDVAARESTPEWHAAS